MSSSKKTSLSQLKNKKSKKESQIEEIEGQLERFKSMLEENKATFQKEFGFDAEEIQQNELNEKLKTKYTARLTEIDLDIRSTIQNKFAFALLIPHFDQVKTQIENEKNVRLNKAIKHVADTLSFEIVDEIKKFEEQTRKKPLTEEESSDAPAKDHCYCSQI